MPTRRLSTRKTKEVLRLRFELGLGQRKIARACAISQGAVHLDASLGLRDLCLRRSGPCRQPAQAQDLLFICEVLLFRAHCRIAFFLESICAFLFASSASRRLCIVGTEPSSK